MDERGLHKFINKFKSKFNKPKQTYQNTYEYAFSIEELESINKQNKQKIQELKQDIFTKKKDNNDKVSTDEVLLKLENKEMAVDDNISDDLSELENPEEAITQEKEETIIEEPQALEPLIENSFVNLSEEHQKIVMNKWQEIKTSQIDKDIIEAKDLLNHNYTITYADSAMKFIQYIRREYEVVICYLIGFNNEKQGIYNKTIFSSKMEDEWKYLNNYIKMLEKIRKNR